MKEDVLFETKRAEIFLQQYLVYIYVDGYLSCM